MRVLGSYYALIDPNEVKQKLVRNPAYSGSVVSLNHWRAVPIPPVPKDKGGFYEQLKKSVKREGFRNPIIVYCLPEGLVLGFGTSRLHAAQDLGMLIPAIVNDFTGRFKDYEELTMFNAFNKFQDKPATMVFSDVGIDYHYSIEKNRRQMYDPAGMRWTEHDDVDKSFVDTEFSWLSDYGTDRTP